MAGNDIKQRIVLEGEKEYSNALKEAQRNLKVLRSELKAESAELGKNATAQEKNAVKIKNLKQQIAEQEKVVKTYEAALKEVREKYADNEEAISKWEVKLNDARTTLANMKNSLTDVGDGMKNVQDSANLSTVATNSLADSLSKVASVGGTVSDAIESSFTTLMSTVKDTISIVWEQVVDLAARSNNLVDMAGFWNTSATNIQKWGKAAAAASGTLTDMNDLVTKIVAKSNSDTKNGGILAGVSPENYQDQWEFAMAVMDSLNSMEGTERISAATEIFGKSFTKALDFVNDWDKIKAALNENDVEQGGYGLTEEQINQMSDLYDQVNRLKESWQSLKDMATVNLFGNIAMEVTGNIQNILDAFRDYFNAEDDDAKAAALAKVKENIVQAFQNVRDAISEGIRMLGGLAEELQSSDDAVVRALGTALSGLVSALEWLTDESNWGIIQAGIGGLITLWAVGNIAQAVANIASFAANLKVISAFKGADLAGFATAGASAGTSFGSAFVSAVLAAAPWLAFAATLLNPSDTADDSMEATYGRGWISDSSGNLVYVGEEEYDRIIAEGEAQGKRNLELENGINIPVEEPKPFGTLTHEQTAAVEAMFDAYKGLRNQADNYDESAWDKFDEAYAAIDAAFGDDTGTFNSLMDTMEELVNKLESDGDLDNMEDLPAEWWNKNSLTSEDIKGFNSIPGLMASAVASGVSNIKVTMDGQTVGNLVAPYVSQQIASEIFA